MFSATKLLFANNYKPETRITVQPVDKVAVGGNATLSISAATMGSRMTYRWIRYPGGTGAGQILKEEVK